MLISNMSNNTFSEERIKSGLAEKYLSSNRTTTSVRLSIMFQRGSLYYEQANRRKVNREKDLDDLYRVCCSNARELVHASSLLFYFRLTRDATLFIEIVALVGLTQFVPFITQIPRHSPASKN